MAVLVDSDVLMEVSRGRNAEVFDQWRQLSESDDPILCSPVTVAELWRGARPTEFESLDKLLSVMICVPIDRQVGRTAGDYLRKFARSHALELADAMIAASAAIHGATLWTRNRRHYPMPELRFL